MEALPPPAHALLRLHLTPGVGPVLGRRIAQVIDPAALDQCTPADLARIEGIGAKRAAAIHAGLAASRNAVARERSLLDRAAAHVITLADGDYPPILAEAPDAPLALFVRGSLHAEPMRYPVAIVGSRACTAYGVEQAQRFAAAFAGAGLAVISGGARGVDSAAHAAAARIGGVTVVVLGCGLGHCYPPENEGLFRAVVEAGGALVSEFPFETGPAPENFPIRNRVISGLSLGVLVIEAPAGSGALITARHAVEHHGRDVFAVPGRVDSPASSGCHALIRDGEAALVTSPQDVIAMLESRARHIHDGTHAARFASANPAPPAHTVIRTELLSDAQRNIVEALDAPATVDELADRTGLPPETVRVELTTLELLGALKRSGSRIARA